MKAGLLTAVTGLAVGAVILSGCGADDISLEKILPLSEKTHEGVESYRIHILSERTELDGQEQTVTTMEYVAPDRMRTLTTMAGDLSNSEEQIRIGSKIFTRENETDSWHERDLGTTGPANLDLAGGTVESFSELKNVEKLKDENLNGIDCYHFIGQIGMQAQREEQLALVNQTDPVYDELKKSIDSIEFSRDDLEFWIGKDDYLLRKSVVTVETTAYKNKGEDDEEIVASGSVTTLTFFDYNKQIDIEAPSIEPVQGVSLHAIMRDVSPGINDLEHQKMVYDITIVNRGSETAFDLQLFLDTNISNSGTQTLEPQADTMPVDLAPLQNVIYHVEWEYNILDLTKEKFIEAYRQNVLRATWLDESSDQHEAVLIGGQE